VYLGNESQGIPDSRRRHSLTELCRDESEREAVEGVVLHLVNARLLVTSGDMHDIQSGQATVEMIHDALLREWARLQGWLKEDRRFLVWRQELYGRVQEWVETGPADP